MKNQFEIIKSFKIYNPDLKSAENIINDFKNLQKRTQLQKLLLEFNSCRNKNLSDSTKQSLKNSINLFEKSIFEHA